MVGIAVAGEILLAIAGPSNASEDGQPADWVNWLKIVLGVLLVLLAAREWRARPAADAEVAMPKWMGALDDITPLKAGGLAILLGTVNPTDLLFIVGGAAAVAQSGVSASDETAAWIVFTLVATVGVAAPLVVYFVMGGRASGVLDGLKSGLARNNTAVMGVLCLIIGIKLVGDAIAAFS